jgi:hypothetical protein
MKKCPTCGKEFEDSMKFCQIDGTSLENVAEEAPFDPYATMVAMPSKPAESQLPELEVLPPLEADPVPQSSTHDDVLDLGEPDPLKTVMVSSEEMQQAMTPEPQPERSARETQVMPTPDSYITPEPTPNVEEPSTPSYGEMAPPPSPFSTPEPEMRPEPATPAWDEAATMMQPPVNVPFDPPSPVQEWTPPPVPDASWQNQQIGSNTPFQPPPAGAGGQNKTLGIISLICGILSLLCCISVLTGPLGLILGYLQKKKIAENPSEYGGAGLATAGMITGGLGTALGVILIILQIFFGVLNNLGR